VGDLELDTRPEPQGEGRYQVNLSKDWEIWGPNGGYVASTALRAAGMEAQLPRPASISCQFLKPGRFDVPLELAVRTVRRSRRTAALQVSCTQEGEPVLEAQVWAVTEVPGLVHDHAPVRHPGRPLDHPTVQERLAAQGDEPDPPFPFWLNFESRPIGWVGDWQHRPAGEPEAGGWYRFVGTEPNDDLWADACRSVVLADTFTWPAAVRAHRQADVEVIAPSLDLHVHLHHPAGHSDWLQVVGQAPIATGGTIGTSMRVWTEDGRLSAMASGTLLCVPFRG
jgi:acyl-CoA thioesterase II